MVKPGPCLTEATTRFLSGLGTAVESPELGAGFETAPNAGFEGTDGYNMSICAYRSQVAKPYQFVRPDILTRELIDGAESRFAIVGDGETRTPRMAELNRNVTRAECWRMSPDTP